MIRYLNKSLADIRSNWFLNLITMVTISLSILVVSLFLLFFENLGRIMDSWGPEGRAMVYLMPEFSLAMRPGLESAIQDMEGITRVTFVSKEQALARLKKEMTGSTHFLDTVKENPLPPCSLEIQIQTRGDFGQVEDLVEKIESLSMVESVEYGRKWLARFLHLFHLFRLTGYVMGGAVFVDRFFHYSQHCKAGVSCPPVGSGNHAPGGGDRPVY